MLLTQRQLRPFAAANFLLPPLNPFPFPHSLKSSLRPTNQHSRCSAHKTWIARPSEDPTKAASTAPRPSPPAEGPVELPPSTPIFATSNEHTPLQTLTSVLLTGAITAFLFRSLRRRAQRAKETRFRSSGEKKSLAEEAVESSTSVTSSSVSKKSSSPSPVEAFLGAVAAGGIALILFKFTATVESALNRQTISDNYSVRQITITIRTIITGLCYLATFVFGANSLGLSLYSGQLAFNSFLEDSISDNQTSSSNSKPGDIDDDSEIEC